MIKPWMFIPQDAVDPENAWRPYCVALLHFDGADGSTTITDECGKTWTANNNAQIDTAQSVFGGASCLFDGSGDYVRTANQTDFDFGTGDFTIDFRIRFNSLPTGDNYPNQVAPFCDGPAGSASQNGFYIGNPNIYYNVNDSQRIVSGEHGMVINTWYHVGLCRNGNDWKIYIDGDLVASANNSINIPTYDNSVDVMGDDYGAMNKFNGNLDEYRILKGFADTYNILNTPVAAYSLT
jgi:hypothetical protein